MAAVILYLILWGAFVVIVNANTGEEYVNFKILPQWLLLQICSVFGLTVILQEYCRKWRKTTSAGSRGKIGEFLTNMYMKHTGLLLTQVEPATGEELLNQLESLKKSDSVIPFDNESDIEKGYALAYTALASGTLTSEQLQKLDQLGDELNASQKRLLILPSICGTKWEMIISLVLLSIGVACSLALIQIATPLGFKFFFIEGILLYGICFWTIFHTPIYMVNEFLKSWFFKLFYGILGVAGISCASAISTLVNEEGATVTVWKDSAGNCYVSDPDYSVTGFLFIVKLSFGIGMLFIITLILVPFASPVLVFRNFIRYR